MCATIAVLLAFGGSAPHSQPAPFYADRFNLLTVVGPSGEQRPVRTAADWRLRRSHILANMQKVMGPVPRQWASLPLDVKTIEEVQLPRAVRKKITFRVEPEDVESAYLFIPSKP